MTSKQIVFIVSEDWVFISHRFHLAEYAAAQGMSVTVMCNVTQYGDKLRKAGFNLIDWKLNRGSKSPIVLICDLFRITRLIKSLSPDILHVVAIKPVVLVGLISLTLSTVRCIYCITGLGFIYTSNRLSARLLRPFVSALFKAIFAPGNSDVVVQNKDDELFFKTVIGVKPHRLRLIKGAGIDVFRFVPSGEPSGLPVVSLPARLLLDKGVNEFVEVACRVNSNEKRANFQLLGSPDPENPNSLSEVQLTKWHEEGSVHWSGHQSDMVSALQTSHIVCFPSYREGLPKALLEACACGKPIVAFDVPGVREIVQDQVNGYLVPFGDIARMAQCVERLILDKALRTQFGEAGRAMVEGEFSQASVQAQFGALWSEEK